SELEEKLKSIADKIPIRYQATKIRSMYYRIAAVASILLVLGTSTWWFYHQYKKENQLLQNDIAPGSNKAVLTLADGQTIHLSENQKGIIVKDGSISYQDGFTLALNDGKLMG